MTSPTTVDEDADLRILHEFSEQARRLLDRHYSVAREWFPHEYVPWEDGKNFRSADDYDPNESPLPEAVRSALWINLLTEDNLAHYFNATMSVFRGVEPWVEWERRWMAEEGRHSIAMRDYVTITRALDPVKLERARFRQILVGYDLRANSAIQLVVYAAMQELATRLAHRNTATLLPDPLGYKIMHRIAVDENLHHLFFRDAATAMVETHPNEAVVAICRQVRMFQMPGTTMDGYREHARRVAAAGIYDAQQHVDHVLKPLLFVHWKLDALTGLSGRARDAQEDICQWVDRLERGAAATRARAEEETARAGAGDRGATI